MASANLPENPNEGVRYDPKALRTVYLAGGCFWGVQAYFARIPGVAATRVGYANGKTERAAYEELKRTGHAETVEVRYDPARVSLSELARRLFAVIDPVSVNRQGGDAGTQYRTGLFYTDPADRPVLLGAVAREQRKHREPVATEVLPLQNFCPAEEYHQDYLEKNPGGYCHIDFSALQRFAPEEAAGEEKPQSETPGELRARIGDEAYYVTRQNGTEAPFENAYWENFEPGIYVDVVTGEPLFLSKDKFRSACGWPAFAKPIEGAVTQRGDDSFGMRRTEVRSLEGDSHLGHVFDDGPRELGGRRYCINSAALRFIRREEMEAEGYGRFLPQLSGD